MDLKYITSTQTLEVLFEGKTRRFELQSVSTRFEEEGNSIDALAHDLDALGLDAKPHVWTVGWDSTVVVVDGSNERLEPQENVFAGKF